MGKLALTRFRVFLGTSAVIIAVVVAASGLIVGSFFSRYVREQDRRQAMSIVQTQARQHLLPSDFDPLNARPGVFAIFKAELPDVFRIKVYDARGRIVWSDEPRLIGRAFPDDPWLAQALAGRVVATLSRPRATENVYERDREYVTETYVPVYLEPGAPLVGVVEAYRDVGAIVAGIRATEREIWSVATVMGVVLWVSLGFVVWKASESERRAMDRLAAQSREQSLLHRFTSSLLLSLEPADVARTTVDALGQGLDLAGAAVCRVPSDGPLVAEATWTAAGAGAWIPPARAVADDATRTGRAMLVDGMVVAPFSTPRTPLPSLDGDVVPMPRLLVATLARPAAAVPVVLEIMLNEAAIAMANAELFTAIRDAHQRLAAIMAGIADRMLIVDRQMRLVWTNTVARERNGLGAEALGTPCFRALGQEADACDGCPALRTLESGKVERGVRTERSAEGRVRYLDLVTAPLADDAGRVHEVLEVARDITDLVEMEERLKQFAARLEDSHAALVGKTEELERTNEALRHTQAQLVSRERLAAVGETVVGLHHAILNPLAGIVGALQVLKLGDLSATARAEALDQAEGEARKIETVIRRMASLRRASGTPYVGATSMLDLESSGEGEAT